MKAAVPRLEARIKELRDLDLSAITTGDEPAVENLSGRISATLASIYGENSAGYARLRYAEDIDLTPRNLVLSPFADPTPTPPDEIREGVDRGRKRAIALLEGEVHALKESLQYSSASAPAQSTDRPVSPEVASDEIFVVHGHDDAAKNEVARFLEKAGLHPVILHEQPNAGRTIIEKFERYGGSAGFAVVILTPDDVGGPSPAELRARARQNVIGEMFWFAGRLGRQRVCALKKGDIEIPSDFAGVVYTEMDERGAWRTELLKELRAAGYKVDWERALA
jgi:predicted nucleotide-binding protein